jgi:TonB family protein
MGYLGGAQIYRVGCGVSAPSVRYGPRALFSPKQTTSFHSATVIIHLIITDTGQVNAGRIISSPDNGVSNSVLQAARKYRFSPARLSGKPVWVEIKAEIPVADGKLARLHE